MLLLEGLRGRILLRIRLWFAPLILFLRPGAGRGELSLDRRILRLLGCQSQQPCGPRGRGGVCSSGPGQHRKPDNSYMEVQAEASSRINLLHHNVPERWEPRVCSQNGVTPLQRFVPSLPGSVRPRAGTRETMCRRDGSEMVLQRTCVPGAPPIQRRWFLACPGGEPPRARILMEPALSPCRRARERHDRDRGGGQKQLAPGRDDRAKGPASPSHWFRRDPS